MSGKIYNKNYTFLKDQTFAENLLVGLSYKRRNKLSGTRDSSLPTQLLKSNQQSLLLTPMFGKSRITNKSEKMKKAESRLAKHFCYILEQQLQVPYSVIYSAQYSGMESKMKALASRRGALELLDTSTREFLQKEMIPPFSAEVKTPLTPFPVLYTTPHLLVSVDSMRNTLAATRTSRTLERIKSSSQFKRNLRECRKIRLLYGNLPKRHLCRGTTKMRLPGENILLLLESRLDVVLERCGFFVTIKSARQSVLNRQIIVNSKVVTAPGFLLKGGDIIKVVQEREKLLSLNKEIPRGAILANTVFPVLERNKGLAATLSKSLPTFNLSLQEDHPFAGNTSASKTSGLSRLAPDLPGYSFTRKNTNLDTYSNFAKPSISHDKSKKSESKTIGVCSIFKPFSSPDKLKPAFRDLSAYSSFLTWLIKKGDKGLDQKTPLVTPSPRCSATYSATYSATSSVTYSATLSTSTSTSKNKDFLFIGFGDKEFLEPYTARLPKRAPSCANWRFIGSPHLMVSLFLFNLRLQRFLCFVQEALIKSTLANKEFGNHKSYKAVTKHTFLRRECLARPTSRSTRRCLYSCKNNICTRLLNVTTIFSASRHFAINTTHLETHPSTQNSAKVGKDPYYSYPACDSVEVSSKVMEGLGIAPLRGVVAPLSFTMIEPFLHTIRQAFQNSKMGLVKDRTGRSLFPKSETISPLDHSLWERYVNVFKEVYNHLFTHQWFVCCNQHDNLKEDGELLFVREQKQVDSTLVNLNQNNRVDVLLSDLYLHSLFTKREVLAPRSGARARQEKELHANTRKETGYKKNNLNQSKIVLEKRQTKPLHLEVSYQSLSAVYLYPPQRVYLPIMVDVDCLVKAFL